MTAVGEFKVHSLKLKVRGGKLRESLVVPLLNWFATHARDLPWRRTSDPYAVWVSEIMLQQTQVKTVIPYWERWMRELPTIQALADAPAEKIHKLWEGLGYYTRVRNLQAAAQTIVRDHQDRFPADFDAVLDLPGIGRYTAGAICSIAFNQPRPILDGNVIRVLTRVFGIRENPRDKAVNIRLWRLAEELVQTAAEIPGRNCSNLNQSLMELGALICTPRQPKCDVCPIHKHCVALREGCVEELPNLDKRAATTQRTFVAFVIRSGDRYLIRQRPEGVVNAHLWEFPNTETTAGETEPARVFASMFGHEPARCESLCEIRHSITRYRITQKVYRIDVGTATKLLRRAGVWRSLAQLAESPFTGAHLKILKKLVLHPPDAESHPL